MTTRVEGCEWSRVIPVPNYAEQMFKCRQVTFDQFAQVR